MAASLVEADRDFEKAPLIQTGADGLLDADEKTRAAAGASAINMIVGGFLVVRVVSFSIATAIYKFGNTASYDQQAVTVFNGDESGMGAYVFFSAAAWSVLVWWLNHYPTMAKASVMVINWPVFPGPPLVLPHKDLRTNMYIYRVSTDGSPAALLDENGDAGMYNRANRSLHHFTEWASGAVFTSICASQVFRFPVFVVILIMSVGRVVHQVGYSKGGHGSHAPGFFIFWMTYTVLENFCLIAGFKQLMSS